MASLAEIVALLTTVEILVKKIEGAWGQIKEYIDGVKDEKKRKAFLDACERRDADAVRKLLFD